MKRKIACFYVNKLKALSPFVVPTLFVLAMSSSAVRWNSDIDLEKRLLLLIFLFANFLFLAYAFSVVRKPKLILTDNEISLRSFLGKYEVIERSICEIKIGQDYIDFKDTKTSKVHHLGQNPFSLAEWSKLVDALN